MVGKTRRRTYGCAYCSSHTAVMGTVWKGSGLSLDKNAKAMDEEPSPDVFSPKELAAINIAKKVWCLEYHCIDITCYGCVFPIAPSSDGLCDV